jgi:hypothetical protein
VFLKFGSYEHIDALHKFGKIHCKSLHYFTTIEDNKTRGDKDENCDQMKFYPKGHLKLTLQDFKPFSIDVSNAQFKEFINSPVGNLFCLFALPLAPFRTPKPMFDNG